MIGAAHGLHQAFFGAVAAVGFGVLFNFGSRSLVWAAAAGALALATRSILQSRGWTLEASTFVAALAAAFLAYGFLSRLGAAASAIALAGCIPMIPGAFFGNALLGFLAVTAPAAQNADATFVESLQAFLQGRVHAGRDRRGADDSRPLVGHKGF